METYVMYVNGQKVLPVQKKVGVVISDKEGVVTFNDGTYCFTRREKDLPYWVKQ